MLKKGKIFYGWWIVWATAIMNVFIGGVFFYGFTVFFNPIRGAFGWTATVTSVAFIFQRLEMGFFGPLAGFLVDRVGPRKLMLFGWVVFGLGYILMSRINSLWAFYGSFIVIATGASFGSFVVTTTAISKWFKKKRSRALTLMYVGFGASGLLVPLITLSINQFDWRGTLVIIGVVLWVVGLPLCLVMRHKPEQYGYLPDGDTVVDVAAPTEMPAHCSPTNIIEQTSDSSLVEFTTREALRAPAFWLLAFVSLFQHIATSAIMVHIVPYLESVNISSVIASVAVTGTTLCSLIGRLGFGILGDFKDKRYLMAIALTFQGSGVFIFSFVDVNKAWLIIPFLLLYAPGYGGPIPLRPAMLADYFGTRNFGIILGLMMLVGMAGGLAGPVFAGWVFDTTGSYQLAFQVVTLTTVVAIPLALLAKPPRAKQEL